jgi:hypothetical protein
MSESIITGCTHPAALNYNAAATVDDGSCAFVLRSDNGTVCHHFTDSPPVEDRSFTLSWSLLGNSWVFYHDYLPDMYFHTRDQLYSVRDNRIYRHNDGAPGVYYEGAPKSFFIDIVFPDAHDFTLHTATWTTELLNSLGTERLFETLTHVSVWNSYQHSGRIPLSQVWEELHYTNIRRTRGEWSFNDFVNILREQPGDFVSSLFQNYALQQGAVDTEAAWYDKGQLQDRWVCLRLELDNTAGTTLLLHEANITALKSDR